MQNEQHSSVIKVMDRMESPKQSQINSCRDTSPHRMAEHRPTGSETPQPRSSRYGSELPSVEDAVGVWCYAILELHARNDDDDETYTSH